MTKLVKNFIIIVVWLSTCSLILTMYFFSPQTAPEKYIIALCIGVLTGLVAILLFGERLRR